MDPYREAVNLNITLTWGGRETKDRASVSTSPLFEELLINNTESRDISTNNKMHGNAIVIKKTMTKLK